VQPEDRRTHRISLGPVNIQRFDVQGPGTKPWKKFPVREPTKSGTTQPKEETVSRERSHLSSTSQAAERLGHIYFTN
jgi:hypothetical protein